MSEENEVEVEEIVEDSITADLAAAWDAAEAEEVEDTPDGQETVEQEAEAQPETAESTDPEADSEGELPEASQDDANVDNPPVSLSPAAREVWKDAPEALKKEFAKRERDFATGLQKSAENANRATKMDEVLRPFETFFQIDGGQPSATIKGLLQTGAALQMGAPTQKAHLVADIIKKFNVPIEDLDNILSGGDVPRGTQQPQQPVISPEIIQQMVDQRLMEQSNVQQGQVAQSEIQQFASDPKHEFYNDVRGDMADVLDIAAKQGRTLTLEQAYNKACLLNDEVSNIMRARQSAPTAAQRRANKSITGAPSGTKPVAAPDSLRDALEMAWENVDLG